jgi:predicted PP-loop superfamily ATPase
VITAHEAAGDLWLQVYRYDEARRAYTRAVERLGRTRRTTLGLARVAVRLSDEASACEHYRALVAGWGGGDASAEIVEARAFVARSSCKSTGTIPPR